MIAIEIIRAALKMNEMDLALIEDMRDAPFTQPTEKGGNHPLWVLGHLALTEAMFRHMITGEPNTLEDWSDVFGPGTQPQTDAGKYPEFDEVLRQYKTQRSRCMDLLEELGDAGMGRPLESPPQDMPAEVAEQFFSTAGRAFITMANHHAFHCGQVADARRAAGRDPMFM